MRTKSVTTGHTTFKSTKAGRALTMERRAARLIKRGW